MDLESTIQVAWKFHNKHGVNRLITPKDLQYAMSAGQHNTELSIASVTAEDEGKYECLIYYKKQDDPDKIFITSGISQLKVHKSLEQRFSALSIRKTLFKGKGFIKTKNIII